MPKNRAHDTVDQVHFTIKTSSTLFAEHDAKEDVRLPIEKKTS